MALVHVLKVYLEVDSRSTDCGNDSVGTMYKTYAKI